jgi:hypothetical protein
MGAGRAGSAGAGASSVARAMPLSPYIHTTSASRGSTSMPSHGSPGYTGVLGVHVSPPSRLS